MDNVKNGFYTSFLLNSKSISKYTISFIFLSNILFYNFFKERQYTKVVLEPPQVKMSLLWKLKLESNLGGCLAKRTNRTELYSGWHKSTFTTTLSQHDSIVLGDRSNFFSYFILYQIIRVIICGIKTCSNILVIAVAIISCSNTRKVCMLSHALYCRKLQHNWRRSL